MFDSGTHVWYFMQYTLHYSTLLLAVVYKSTRVLVDDVMLRWATGIYNLKANYDLPTPGSNTLCFMLILSYNQTYTGRYI